MRTTIISLLLFAGSALADGSVPLADILDEIEARRDEAIPFVETRHSQLLEQPLILHGHVIFTADAALSKRIEQPVRESVTISPDGMELEREGKRRRVSLDKRADVKVFYAGMRALLDGDAEALDDIFEVSTNRVGSEWRIVLVPKDAGLRTFVDKLTISGSGARVLTVETEQPGGDRQEMSFRPDPH